MTPDQTAQSELSYYCLQCECVKLIYSVSDIYVKQTIFALWVNILFSKNHNSKNMYSDSHGSGLFRAHPAISHCSHLLLKM